MRIVISFYWKWEWAEIWTPQILLRIQLLAVLVSISMDHMSFLGNTLAQIAEKKGRDHQRRLQSGDCQTEAGSNAGDRERSAENRMYHTPSQMLLRQRC